MRLWMLIAAILLVAAACAPTDVASPEIAIAPDRLLEYGGAEADALQEGFAAQNWLFVARAGQPIQLSIDSEQALSLQLAAPDGQLIASGSSIVINAPADGTYTATIARGSLAGTAIYTLSLESVPPPTATATTTASPTPTVTPSATPTPVYAALGTYLGQPVSGQTINGRFEQTGDTQVIAFAGMAGQFLFLRLQTLDGAIDPALTLFDSQGAVLLTDEESGGADTPLFNQVQLPYTGDYFVQLRADSGGGDYQVAFRLDAQPALLPTSAPPSPTPPISALASPLVSEDSVLRDHVPASGQVERPGDFARFTIEAQANDVLTVAARASDESGLRPAFEFYDPEGALLARAEAASGGEPLALASAVSVPVDGIYSVFVLGLNDTTGSFSLAFGRDGSYADNPKIFAPPDVPSQATLPALGMRDVWFVSLSAGDVITAAVIAESAGFDPALELANTDGLRIAYDDSGTQNPVIQQAVIPDSGTYLLRVTGANAGSAGSYRLVWRYLTAAPTPTPQPVASPLMSADDALGPGVPREYRFLGQAGQRIRVNVAGTDATPLDPVAAVFAPDGTLLIEVDDSGASLNPQFDLDLPATGVYVLRVGSYGEAGGAFIARVERLNFE
ncbi:MAG: hypothetical protein KJ065_00635 [Anaerolineae bacterium]|nr:hypothetical protein [Anaerolineae bacterium]